jgi:hypothetical protein
LFISRGAILATFSSRFLLTAPVQSDGGADQLAPIPASNAETHEPISPTTGATISTLESISFGSMSIWMNFFGASPQVLPLPCDSSQLRRAPISITTSASLRTVERAAPAHCGCRSDNSPLAMLMGRNGAPLFSTKARMASSAWA